MFAPSLRTVRLIGATASLVAGAVILSAQVGFVAEASQASGATN